MNLDKVLQDPLYRHLWNQTQSEEQLTQAGFFDDGLSELNYHLHILTTPVDKLKKPITNKPVVLLTTGGFAPVHEGHLYMMAAAKDKLTEQGYEVIGGYISPSHDAYAHQKYPGAEKLSIYEKIELLRTALQNSDFLMVDPFEGLYTPGAINFTDCIYRLEQYLQKHLGYSVQVAYVFGGDNGGFARAFKDSNYLAVCVARNNIAEFIQLKIELQNDKNIFFIDENPHQEVASRKLIGEAQNSINPTLPYLVRDDLSFYGISGYWSDQLLNLLQGSTPHPVVSLNWRDQQKMVDNLKTPLINLDPLVSGGIKIEVSRIFPVSTGQHHSRQLVNRPHSQALEEQVKVLTPGDYLLVEDDVASGFTVNYLKSLLPEGVNISAIKTLTEYSFYQHFDPQTPFKFWDIVDLRDFILGLPHGGLVVELPNGQIARSIYALPFVNLATRAKIDPQVVVRTSKMIWQLNYAYYQPKNIILKDLDLYTQNLFLYMGFPPTALVKDICQQMRELHYD
jgi:nicotinic acid mononucleotide adenylyltransferase